MLKPEDIFKALVQKNMDDPGNTAAYLDTEANTLWVLADESTGHMAVFWSPDHLFRFMTDTEINEFIVNATRPED